MCVRVPLEGPRGPQPALIGDRCADTAKAVLGFCEAAAWPGSVAARLTKARSPK